MLQLVIQHRKDIRGSGAPRVLARSPPTSASEPIRDLEADYVSVHRSDASGPGAKVAGIFDLIDLDRDGRLSYAEMLKLSVHTSDVMDDLLAPEDFGGLCHKVGCPKGGIAADDIIAEVYLAGLRDIDDDFQRLLSHHHQLPEEKEWSALEQAYEIFKVFDWDSNALLSTREADKLNFDTAAAVQGNRTASLIQHSFAEALLQTANEGQDPTDQEGSWVLPEMEISLQDLCLAYGEAPGLLREHWQNFGLLRLMGLGQGEAAASRQGISETYEAVGVKTTVGASGRGGVVQQTAF